MGLADEIMGTPKPEDKKVEQKKEPSPGMEFVQIPQIGDDGKPTGQMITVEQHTGLNYRREFDAFLADSGKPRKHPPTLRRGVVYDEEGRPLGLGGERAGS